jgi:hypothetical protein
LINGEIINVDKKNANDYSNNETLASMLYYNLHTPDDCFRNEGQCAFREKRALGWNIYETTYRLVQSWFL